MPIIIIITGIITTAIIIVVILNMCVLPAINITLIIGFVLPQWQAKDPGHSANSAGGRLHLNTHTPMTQRSRSRLTLPLSSTV